MTRDTVLKAVSVALAVARSRWTRWIVGGLAAALAVWAVAAEWDAVVGALGRLDPAALVLALVATAGNLVLAGAMWRVALADLGSRLGWATAARVYFVGQVGKYIPGSVWPMIMQAELASDHGVPRRRSATASAVSLLFAVASGMLVVLVALPFVPDVLPDQLRAAALLIVPLAVVLHPSVFGRLADTGLRLIGRDPLEHWTSLRGTLVAIAWGAGSWAFAGLQVFALAVPLGAPADARTLVLCLGGYALAWALGFLVFMAPAGVGAREFALAAVLSTVLGTGEVVVVVLVSRVMFTVADLAAAGVGMGLGRWVRNRPVAVS